MFYVLSIHLIVSSLAVFNQSNAVGWGSAQACRPQKKNLHKYLDVFVECEWEWEDIGNCSMGENGNGIYV